MWLHKGFNKVVLACIAFAKFVPFSVRWSRAFLDWSYDRLDFPFQFSAVFLHMDHPVCSLEPALESTNRIKNQDLFDSCPEDNKFGVSAGGRSANCFNAWIFNTGYHFVGLCRIHYIYKTLLSQFDSLLKLGTPVGKLADGLISRNILWSKRSASCVMYNHLTNNLKD